MPIDKAGASCTAEETDAVMLHEQAEHPAAASDCRDRCRRAPRGFAAPVRVARRAFWDMESRLPSEPLVDVDLNEALLNAWDVAGLLNVPRASVYEYARRQHRPLPSLMIGRHRRFYRSDLEAWLAEQRQPRQQPVVGVGSHTGGLLNRTRFQPALTGGQ